MGDCERRDEYPRTQLQNVCYQQDDELYELKEALAQRLDDRPFRTWSPRLIRAVIGVIDLAEPPPIMPRERVRPRGGQVIPMRPRRRWAPDDVASVNPSAHFSD